MPMFGVRSFTPQTKCKDIHPRGPLPPGSKLICMCGHESGQDSHPRLRYDALDRNSERKWPAAEPPPAPELTEHAGGKGDLRAKPKLAKTRREKRAELHAVTESESP